MNIKQEIERKQIDTQLDRQKLIQTENSADRQTNTRTHEYKTLDVSKI